MLSSLLRSTEAAARLRLDQMDMGSRPQKSIAFCAGADCGNEHARRSQNLLSHIKGLAINVAIHDGFAGDVPDWMLACPAVHLLDRRTRK